MIRKSILAAAVLLLPMLAPAQVKMLRHPSSSKGKIAFSYLHDDLVAARRSDPEDFRCLLHTGSVQRDARGRSVMRHEIFRDEIVEYVPVVGAICIDCRHVATYQILVLLERHLGVLPD